MVEREKMNIVCVTDDNYVLYCGIMLTSLYENNRDVEITTYILTRGLCEDNRDRLSRLAESYKTKIEIITLADDTLPDCPGPGIISWQQPITDCPWLKSYPKM